MSNRDPYNVCTQDSRVIVSKKKKDSRVMSFTLIFILKTTHFNLILKLSFQKRILILKLSKFHEFNDHTHIVYFFFFCIHNKRQCKFYTN
jgi:hypothetical protein